MVLSLGRRWRCLGSTDHLDIPSLDIPPMFRPVLGLRAFDLEVHFDVLTFLDVLDLVHVPRPEFKRNLVVLAVLRICIGRFHDHDLGGILPVGFRRVDTDYMPVIFELVIHGYSVLLMKSSASSVSLQRMGFGMSSILPSRMSPLAVS